MEKKKCSKTKEEIFQHFMSESCKVPQFSISLGCGGSTGLSFIDQCAMLSVK